MEPRNRCQGINSASLCSLAGRYDNPIPTPCLAPIYFLKIPALGLQCTQYPWLFNPQSTYRGRVEMGGGVYLPSYLELTYNFVCDGRYCRLEWKGMGVHQVGEFFHHDGMFAGKWPLPLCVFCGLAPRQAHVLIWSRLYSRSFQCRRAGSQDCTEERLSQPGKGELKSPFFFFSKICDLKWWSTAYFLACYLC